jgi:hypothetical protein
MRQNTKIIDLLQVSTVGAKMGSGVNATMTLHDKLQIIGKSAKLREAGKEEEAMKMAMSVPLSPWMAEWYKKYIGVEYLRTSGWNLSEAEAVYGSNWLDT